MSLRTKGLSLSLLCYVVTSNFVTLISEVHGPFHRILESQVGKDT